MYNATRTVTIFNICNQNLWSNYKCPKTFKTSETILLSAVQDQQADIHMHTYEEYHSRVDTTKCENNFHSKLIDVLWPNQYLVILNITATFICSFSKQKSADKFGERR